MRRLYNAALLPLRAASWFYGRWPRGSAAALERDQRLARRLPVVPAGAVWLHGASVGEARLVAALARGIKAARPSVPIVSSAVTATGRALLPEPPLAEAAFFLPLDFPEVQRRTFDAIRPDRIVLVETELWPNLLAEARARAIPVALVNARLSPERLARYGRLRALYVPLMRTLAVVATASAAEAERFRTLGVPADRVHVTGNLKFDLQAPDIDAAALRDRLGLAGARPVVIAGSTGVGEDPIVLDAFARARATLPDLLLVLAPRHPDRFASAAALAGSRGYAVRPLSTMTGSPSAPTDVIVVDTIGRLADLYALGSSSFVGGSLVRVGGHNLLEPLAAGSPVLFGPHTGHVAEIAQALVDARAGERVRDADAPADAWIRLATDPDLRRARTERGRSILEANRGAVARTVDLLLAATSGSVAERGAEGA
jgi:3-deoxy-D-manno-octulosonic-acid transferase